ncbi:MAG: hypothetical protein AB3N23_13560 [Paracoccaceae bacterium]
MTQEAFSVDTSALSLEHRFDVISGFMSGVFEVERREIQKNEFAANIDLVKMADCPFGAFRYGSFKSVRMSPNSVIRRLEGVLLVYVISGSVELGLNFTKRVLSPGTVAIVDYEQPFYTGSPERRHISMTIPYDMIGYQPGVHEPLIEFSPDSPLARVIGTTLLNAHRVAKDCSQLDLDLLGRGVTALLRSMISTTSSAETIGRVFARDVKRSVCRYIVENLQEEDISVDKICVQNGVSRASLYRMFEPEGGVRKYVVSSRLQKIYDELSKSEPGRGVITRTINKWGLFDPSTFNKQFREKFNCKPSEVIGTQFFEAQSERASGEPIEHGLLQFVERMSPGEF